MNRMIILIIAILLLLGVVGYLTNHFTEVADAKKVQAIMERHEAEKKELTRKVNILEYEALEARRLAEAAKSRANQYRIQRESIQIPRTAEETIERLHKLGYTSERMLR